MSANTTYTYTKLDKEKQEIRLVTLLPSQGIDDPIRITISHVPFIVEEKELSARPDIEEIGRSLPAGWEEGWSVYETVEGRLLFRYWDEKDKCRKSTWKSPCHSDESSWETQKSITFEPKFEALSYTWGSNADPQMVYVLEQDQTHQEEQQLELTANLASAFKDLRYTDRSRALWVDAVCINQQDLTERNEQVLRMRDLYKHAGRVVVWLGPSARSGALALSTLEHIGKQCELAGQRLLSSPNATEPEWYLAEHSLPYDEDTWHSIYELLMHPWFDRVWIVQEIQLANPKAIMQCGTEQVPWYFFRRGVICLMNKLHCLPRNLMGRLTTIGEMCNKIAGWALPELLMFNTIRKCVDPLDKVYGILGITPLVIASGVVPDYALSTVDGYKAAFLKYTSLTQRLGLLDHCNSKELTREWPSWVPDWSIQNAEADYISLGFYSSCDSAAQWNYSSPNIMEATGIQVGTVVQISELRSSPQGGISELISELGLDKFRSLHYPNDESVLDAYIHVRYRGQFRETVHCSDFPHFVTLPEARRIILGYSGNTSMDAYQAQDQEWISKRKIIQTAEGDIGLAPEQTKTGKLGWYTRAG
jgi:hypothetical protein